MSRTKVTKYTRLTLGTPKPGVSFGGEPLNEHNLHDESGKVVGNIKVRDRGPMLHVDWIGGHGLGATAGGLGNEAMRSIHDAIATHYPNAKYLTGHRISGFRSKQTTGERVVVPIRRNVKMSRTKPKRYAKFNKETKAHPLVAGFPIEHALRHIANHPQSNDDQKNLAVAALKGHTEALWLLNDALQEHDHPINKAGYKWLNAADKLHLDKHTYTALTEAAQRERAAQPHAEHYLSPNVYNWHFTPEHQALRAVHGINSHPGSISGGMYQDTVNRVKELSPDSSDEDIKESIRRHGHRATQVSSERVLGHSPDSQNRAILHPDNHKKPDAFSYKNEMASRYKRKPIRYSLANKSNFIGALLKASSPEHKMFVQRTKQLAKQAGARQTREFPALHDTPNQSVPGVALAVYGHIQPDNAHALGSWVNGLLPNSPGYAIFHARPTGPDTLYRIRMEGSGHDARAKLDRSGITSRVFVPHRKGLDVLIPDKGNQLGQLVQSFATQQKVPVESSQGHITTVGSQDQAQARNTFRNKVVTAENKMSRNVRRDAVRRYGVAKPLGGKINPFKDSPSKPFGSSMDEVYGDTREAPASAPLPGTIAPSPKKQLEPPDDAKEFHYEPGLLPPTAPTPKKTNPGDTVDKLPKGIKQKEWNPTLVPPKEKPLFSTAEYNKLHAWAHKHAFTHTPAFAKFLGKNDRDPAIHSLLVKAIVHAAHDMRRSGNTTSTARIGDTSKRIKVNIPRTSWINVKTQGKTVKLKPKAEHLSRYSRRRLSLNTYGMNLDYSLGA